MEFDFEANASIDSLDNVPDEYKGLYAKDQAGSKYVIADNFKGVVSALTGLGKTVKNTRKENETLKKNRVDLTPWKQLGTLVGVEGDDITPDVLKAGIEGVLEKAKNGSDLKVNMEKLRKEIEDAASLKLKSKDEELNGMLSTLNEHMVISAATAALAEEKGSPELLLPVIRQHAKLVKDSDGRYVVRVLDDQGEVRGDGKGGFMTVAALIKEMKGSKSYGRAFESTAPAGGGGAPRNGAARPIIQNNQGEKTANQKIAAGLSARGINAG